MIDHISLHVTDLKTSKDFYLAALQPIGYEAVMEFPEWNVVGLGANQKPDLWLEGDGAGKPTHIAFVTEERQKVDAFYEAGIKAGGKDNGKPGLRPQYHSSYYGAFVIDPDGNNIEVVCHKSD